MHDENNNFDKEIETIKKTQPETLGLKTTMIVLKTLIENFIKKLDHEEGRISKLKGR